MRICSTCSVEKSLADFSKHVNGKYGKRSSCKSCCAAYRADNRERVAAIYAKNKVEISAKQRAYRLANLEKVRAQDAARYLANPENKAISCAKFYAKNKQKLNDVNRAWAKANPAAANAIAARYRAKNLEKVRALKAAWNRANPAICRAGNSKRKAAKRRGSPPWLALYSLEMKMFYRECTRLGFTADHIVPLQGKTVCGLHVPWNMAMLTVGENSRKGNRSWPNN